MLTHVQIHFVRDIINHRLLFGEPREFIKLDEFRRLAVFEAGRIFGYVRWRANEYGTQDWRLFIVKTGSVNLLTPVPGISPAVKLLVSASGSKEVKRSLKLLDKLKSDTAGNLESIPESYWHQFQNCLTLRLPMRNLPRNRVMVEASNVS